MMREFYLRVDQELLLHCCRWEPETAPKAVVQIIHGIAEYVARYDKYASFLAQHGILVVGEDHAGHGGTAKKGGQLGYMTGGWKKAVEGVHKLYTRTHEEYPDVPYFMLGHSMGSFLLRTYLCVHNDTPLAGALLSGTGWQNPAVLKAGRTVCAVEKKRVGEKNASDTVQKLMFDSFNKAFQPNRTPFDWLSTNEAEVDAYAADPDCGFAASVQLSAEMLGGMDFNQQKKNLAKMNKKLPVLFYAGDQDPVGSMGKGVTKAAEVFRQVGMQDVTVKLYPGMRHETHNEIGREQVFEDVLAWLQSHGMQG